MRTAGRGAVGGVVAAWVLVAGCGERAAESGRADAALQRDLRLAAAAAVALAEPGGQGTRFLPAAEEARPASAPRAAARAPRRAHRVARALGRATPVTTASTPAAAAPVATTALVPTPEPATERLQRYAGEEGASTMLVGVVLRGGAVGDDQCERDLPRTRAMPVALGQRTATLRISGPMGGPRPGGPVPVGMPHAPPF
jgi:hypothetical protein